MNQQEMFKYLFIFLFLTLKLSGFSQDILPDNRSLQKVEIPVERLDRYKNDRAFNYVIKTNKSNFITQAIDWLKRQVYKILYKIFTWLFNEKYAAKWVKIIIKSLPYLAIVLFSYIIFRFLIGAGLISLKKNKLIVNPQVTDLNDEEIIKEADLDRLIKEAVTEKDFRLAIRYYYLKALKLLLDKDLISWHPDKTNRDYVNELKDRQLKPAFNNLTFIYDYVWYGKYTPSDKDFIEIKDKFQKFQVS